MTIQSETLRKYHFEGTISNNTGPKSLGRCLWMVSKSTQVLLRTKGISHNKGILINLRFTRPKIYIFLNQCYKILVSNKYSSNSF